MRSLFAVLTLLFCSLAWYCSSDDTVKAVRVALWVFEHLELLHLNGCIVDAIQSDMHATNLSVMNTITKAASMQRTSPEFNDFWHLAACRLAPNERCKVCDSCNSSMHTDTAQSFGAGGLSGGTLWFWNPWIPGLKIVCLSDPEHALRGTRNAIHATVDNRPDGKQSRVINIRVRSSDGIMKTMPVSWNHVVQTLVYDTQTNVSASVSRLTSDAVELRGAEKYVHC